MLKSNGPHRSKKPPVKFGFSLKTVPANIAKKLPPQRCFKPLFIPVFNFSYKWPTFAFVHESGYTLGSRRKIAHSGSRAETRAFRMGVVSLPSERSARSQTSPGRVSAQQTLLLLGLGRVYSRRTQRAFGTAMRLCASLFRRRRGPAGLRNLLSGLPMFAFLTPCAQGFLRAQCEVRYHDPQYVPHIAEIPGGRLTKQLICRFQRPGKHRSLRGAYFLTKMQIFPLGNSVANTFAV